MENESFVLRKYTSSEFDQYYSIVKEDDVMKFISGKGLSVQEAQNKFALFLEVNSLYPNLGYFQVMNLEGLHLGDCKLEWHRPEKKVLELGYIFKKEFWGMGYGKKICAMLVKKAKEEHPNEPIIGIIDPANLASKKILQGAGFKSYFVGMENGLPTEKLKYSDRGVDGFDSGEKL